MSQTQPKLSNALSTLTCRRSVISRGLNLLPSLEPSYYHHLDRATLFTIYIVWSPQCSSCPHPATVRVVCQLAFLRPLEASSPTGRSCASLSLVQHARDNFISMPHDLCNSHLVFDTPILLLRSVPACPPTIYRSSLPGKPRTRDQGQRYLPRRLLLRWCVCLPSFR